MSTRLMTDDSLDGKICEYVEGGVFSCLLTQTANEPITWQQQCIQACGCGEVLQIYVHV